MKILFLTSRIPFPPIGGDKLRTFNFIKHLKKEHNLTLISFIEKDSEINCLDDYSNYFDRIITIKLSRLSSYLNTAFGIFSHYPLQYYYYKSDKMKQAVEKELNQNKYDLVFAHLIRMRQYLPNDPGLKKIIDFTDAISLNYKRSISYRRGIFSIINKIESRRVKHFELDSINFCDRSIFISEVDANSLSNENNKQRIKIVPNGVDLEKFPYYSGSYNQSQIVFLGNMRTFPNSDAVSYFVNQVLPLIKNKIPDIQVYIVGNEPSSIVKKLDNGKSVIVTGYVDDVSEYVKNSAVLVAPMRVGAGVQNKILEAMALGTPVVTTSIGAEGLEKANLLVADSPEQFATEVLDLMLNESKRRNIVMKNRKYVEDNCTWQSALKPLFELLSELQK